MLRPVLFLIVFVGLTAFLGAAVAVLIHWFGLLPVLGLLALLDAGIAATALIQEFRAENPTGE